MSNAHTITPTHTTDNGEAVGYVVLGWPHGHADHGFELVDAAEANRRLVEAAEALCGRRVFLAETHDELNLFTAGNNFTDLTRRNELADTFDAIMQDPVLWHVIDDDDDMDIA